MDFYIFDKNGNYLGLRGSAPIDNEIGIEATPEAVAFMTTAVAPMVVGGKLTETATPEQIADAQIQITNPISRMRFWLNVWRLLRLTEDNILDQINQLRDSDEKIELLIKVKSASEFDRYDPSLIYMAGQMNIPDEVLNQIFT